MTFSPTAVRVRFLVEKLKKAELINGRAQAVCVCLCNGQREKRETTKHYDKLLYYVIS